MPNDENEGSGSGSHGPGSGFEGVDLLDVHDEVIDVAEEVRAIREEFHFDAVEMAFYTRVLAGKWTMAHRHVPADAIAGYARGELAKQWCRTYKVPIPNRMPSACTATRAPTNSPSSIAGEPTPELEREVCRRGNV